MLVFQITASAFVLFMIVDFALGLVQLWNSSEPTQANQPQVFDTAQKTALKAPKNEFDNDVWLLPLTPSEAPTIAANEIVKSIFTYQLCLPPVSVGTEPLEGLTIRQLKELAKQAKLKGYGKLTKKELVLALQ